MGFTGLFAALADALVPAAEAAPAAFGAAEAAGPVIDAGLIGGAVPGAVAGGVIDTGLIGGAVPGAIAGEAGAGVGGGLAAGIVPEATGTGLSSLAIDTGGPALTSIGEAAGGVSPVAGATGAAPAGVGGGFSGVLGAGPSGPFGDLSALLGPTTPDALSPGISPASMGTAVAQPGIVGGDFSSVASQGGNFLDQISPNLGITTNTTPFAPASTNLASELGLSAPGTPATSTIAPQVATDVTPSVAPINSAAAGGIPNVAAGPPSWFDPLAPGVPPPGPGATQIAATAAPAAETATAPAAAPAAETAAAAPAAGAPSALSTLRDWAPVGTLAASGAGLGLNIANQLNTPTAANVAAAPATDALAQTTPTMDANQMRQLLLNEGMSPAQADQYIVQINQRLASQGATTGSTDSLNQGLVTAG